MIKEKLTDFGVYLYAKRNEGSWLADKLYKVAFKLKLWRLL